MLSLLQFRAHFLNLFFSMKKKKTYKNPLHSSKTVHGIFWSVAFIKKKNKYSEIERQSIRLNHAYHIFGSKNCLSKALYGIFEIAEITVGITTWCRKYNYYNGDPKMWSRSSGRCPWRWSSDYSSRKDKCNPPLLGSYLAFWSGKECPGNYADVIFQRDPYTFNFHVGALKQHSHGNGSQFGKSVLWLCFKNL